MTLDPSDPDPAPTASTGGGAPCLEAVNIGRRLALLSDGTIVPITNGIDIHGESCRLDDPEVFAFVYGMDGLGWWWARMSDWSREIRFH